jgi:dipeptidyl aminopeptidase/acylaminoacyl peptidase
MDEEKSEWLYHIHVSRSDGSFSYQLTRGETSATSPAWSPDGSQIAFTMSDPPSEEEENAEKEKRDAHTVDEDLKMVHLYLLPIERNEKGERETRKLTNGDFSVGGAFGGGEPNWSPDGNSIVFAHMPTPKVDDWTKADISVVELSSGDIRSLAATDAAEGRPVFSPDGEWIAYTSSDDPPTWAFTGRVYVVKASVGEPRLLAATHDLQPDIVGWTPDGSRILVSETQRTINRLSALPVDGGPPVDVSPPDIMVDGPSLNLTGTRLGFSSQAADRPSEVFLSPLEDFAPAQVSTIQDLPDIPIGKTITMRWKSTDGKEVEGLLTYPVGHSSGARVPLVVIVHGGPTGVFVQRFIGNRGAYPIAAFAAQGYAVLRCNVRGSSGYGKDFRYANYQDWGGGDYRDIMSGVDHVIEMGVADPNRLGVMGWSYGGYMTSWIITQTDRFKAASVGAGVTNLMSFTGTSDIPGFIPDYFGGEYWEVFDRWRSHSAMFNVKGVTTPTLIQHGERDIRVPVSQGYELYNALKRQNVSVKMVVFPRQPHGIREPKLQLEAMKGNLEWFEKWIPIDGT